MDTAFDVEGPLGTSGVNESSSKVAPSETHPIGSEEGKTCRFCLSDEHSAEKPLIAPCRCAGSMEYVHRECLDEWRVHGFNPKSLVQCTICATAFRLHREGCAGQEAPWQVRLALDIAFYLAVRTLALLAATFVMGFLPLAGGAVLHPNPLVNHFLGGTTYTFATVGGSGLIYTLWYMPLSSLDLFNLCPRRLSGKDDGLKLLLITCVIVGAFILLWFILRGIYRLVCEARHEIVGAVRGASAQARRKIVQEYVVLDLDETRCLRPCSS